MNIPVIVDVAIGLIFIYLILSLLASEIIELIATVFQWRAQHLRQSIINLLAGDTITDQNIEAAKRLTKDLYNHPLLNDLNQEARGLFSTLFRKITWLSSWVYQKLITGREGVFGNKVTAPSYIPGETFATALIERLGVAKLVETLIEAKLNRFRDSIIDNIGRILDCSGDILNLEALKAGLTTRPSDRYKALQVDLYQICQQFSNHELTLITAIDKISLQLDQFINPLKNEDLNLWKQTLFGKQNELAIVNGGLKPTFEEIADLVNISSGTYQSFENEFEAYFQKRQEQAIKEIQNFLLAFDSSISIIINPKTQFNENDDISLIKRKYSQILVTDSTPPKIGISLWEVGNILIKDHLNDQGNLKSFKEGFGEQGQELLGSKILRWKETLPIAFLVSLVIVTWFAVFPFREHFIRPEGAIGFVVLLIGLFSLFLFVYNIKPNPKKGHDSKSLSNVLDGYFSSAYDIKEFRETFQEKIALLSEDKSRLQWELSRLGQSFRQYYRALVLNNADVDLPFVPTSVKQSVASLVRRTKTKIERTGNEVNQLREEVEIWFDRSMDRSSGVYQRNVRGIAILIGFLLAIVTNSNSIYIVNRLAYDQELRQAVVQGAERFIEGSQSSPSASPTPLDEDKLDENELRDRNQIVSQLLDEQLALPIGWNPRVLGRQLDCELSENALDDDWQKLFDKCIYPQKDKDGKIEYPIEDIFDKTYSTVAKARKNDSRNNIYKEAQKNYQKAREIAKKPEVYFIPTAILVMMLTLGKLQVGLLFLVGWFVTAIAISMGASFWFDLLGKLINVRNTGNRPPSSANQTSVNSEKSS